MKRLFSTLGILLLVAVAVGGGISLFAALNANSSETDGLHTVRFMRGGELVRYQQVGHGALMNVCCIHSNETGFMGWAFYGTVDPVGQVLILRDMTFHALIATDEVLFTLTEHEQYVVTTQGSVLNVLRDGTAWTQSLVPTGTNIRLEFGDGGVFRVYKNYELFFQNTTSGVISVRGRALL